MICTANQLTGFYMRATLAFNGLNCSGNSLKEVKLTLLGDIQIVTKWFYENYMVLNSGKCHFVCLGNNTEKETYFFNNTEMKNSS